MRADRLLSILLLLQARGKVSSRELAGLLEVSERTIVRDMEALSASGVPVFAERGRDGGWLLPAGYRTALTGMKPGEIGSLLLTADSAVIEALGIKEDYSSAVRKLEAAAAQPQHSQIQLLNQRIHIDGAGWHPSGEAYPYLTLLQEAVWTDHKVLIVYSNNDERKERLISPLGLIAKRGVWYAAAQSGGELRTFRVSRIISAELTDDAFTRPAGFDLARYWEESTASFKAALPRYPATLLLSISGMKSLRQERYAAVLTAVPSSKAGWQKVQAEFHTPESACKIILSLGQEAVATAPEELVNMLVESLRGTSFLYEEIVQSASAGESGV